MPIKYGEITIILDGENETFIRTIGRVLFNSELYVYDCSDIIILFDDNTIYNINDVSTHVNFKFCQSFTQELPLYFDCKEKSYFYKQPKITEGRLDLNFKKIFSPKIWNKYKLVSSHFNCIYESLCGNKPEVFSLVKIFSTAKNPRFLFAYDSDKFTKDEIIYLINCIFRNQYNYG